MNILEHLHIGRRHRLPTMLAAEAAECGLACMAMIARYHGHDVDLNGLRQRFSLSLAGASLRSLMGIADQLGFSTRALRAEVGALGKVSLPAIIHWDLNHFVVLKSIGRKTAVVHDPAVGVRTLSLDQFSNHFTGVVRLAPAEGFEPISAKAPIKLSFLWSRLRGFPAALTQILILSVALQIATFAAPFQLQLVVDEALGQSDRDLLLVIALAFGGLVIVQASIEALRGWSLRVFGHLLSFQITGNLVRHCCAATVSRSATSAVFSPACSRCSRSNRDVWGVISSVIDSVMAFIAAFILFLFHDAGAGRIFAVLLDLSLRSPVSQHETTDGRDSRRRRGTNPLMGAIRAATASSHGSRSNARVRGAT
jgi:ATP-binding cassette subfamily B protein RaxB